MSDYATVEKEYKQVQADLKQATDQLKIYAEKTEKELKDQGQITAELKANIDKSLSEHNTLSARFQEIEQKLIRNPDDEAESRRPKSAGELVIESEEMKGVNGSFRGSRGISVPRAAITSIDTSGGALVRPDRRPELIAPPQRRMTVRDLIAPGTTDSNSIEYVRETGFTNNAAIVGEGETKPYSDITFELVTAAVRTIAHLFKASRQILDDAAALRSYIDARARYGLELAEEAQLLFGNGTGNNLTGIATVAAQFTPSFTPAMETAIDRIRLALLQAALAEFPATGIVLNPIDWATIELTKDSQGRYIVGNPTEGNTPRLWNLPVVETPAMTQDNFLVGAFRLGAQIFDRLGVEILISTENDKDFENNMITIRAEERLALAIYRPEAFVTGKVTPTP